MINLFHNHLVKKNLHLSIIKSIQDCRLKNDVVCLYGSPTEGNWLGIANATKSLFPNNSIEIPQYYSQSIFSNKQTHSICTKLREEKFTKIVISGFAPYFLDWIEELYSCNFIETIYHGTISEFHDKSKQEFINKLISYGKSGKIKRFGFVKNGLNTVFSKLYNFDTYHQALPVPNIPSNFTKLNLEKSKIHIGVFGADTFNKNLHNQVLYALILENTLVHVLDKSVFAYLEMDERIVEHGKNLPREEFLKILGSMDLNLYMSYNESWGLVAFESEAMGVPCLRVPDTNYLEEIRAAIASKRQD